MTGRELDELELGRRVVLHLVIENELAPGAREACIAVRAGNHPEG